MTGNPRPNNILFDYAGVITEGYSEALYPRELADKFGVSLEDFGGFMRSSAIMRDLSLGRIDEEEVVATVCQQFPGAQAIGPEKIMTDNYQPSGEILGIIASYRQNTGIGMYLASNIFPRCVSYLRSLDIERYFDRVFFSCEIGARKPDEDFFEYILEDIGAEPGECLFLDDTFANIEAARGLGIIAVQVSSSAEVISTLEEHLGPAESAT